MVQLQNPPGNGCERGPKRGAGAVECIVGFDMTGRRTGRLPEGSFLGRHWCRSLLLIGRNLLGDLVHDIIGAMRGQRVRPADGANHLRPFLIGERDGERLSPAVGAASAAERSGETSRSGANDDGFPFSTTKERGIGSSVGRHFHEIAVQLRWFRIAATINAVIVSYRTLAKFPIRRTV